MTGERRDPFAEARASMESAETPWESVPPTSEQVQVTLLEAAGELLGLLRSIDASLRMSALLAVVRSDAGLSRESIERAAMRLERMLRADEDGAS